MTVKKTERTEALLIAHRGGLFYRPENSLAAFGYSLELGIKWVECDVRLSRDGVPVLFHDDRINLDGQGPRLIRDLSHARLSRFDIGGGEVIPTLGRLFERFGSALGYDVELKELDAVEPVMALIGEYRLERKCFVSSFIPEALQVAKAHSPGVPRGLLVDRLTGNLVDVGSTVKAALLLSCEFLLPHFKLMDETWIKAARGEGLKLIPWTVNQPADAGRLLRMGVDGLISDRPDAFRPPMA